MPRAKLAAGFRAANSMNSSCRTRPRLVIACTVLLGACTVHADAATGQHAYAASITLRRSSCFGNCPAYSVTMTPQGEIRFEGYIHVQTRNAHGYATPTQIAQVHAALERADFHAMRESYVSQDDGCETVMSDQPGVKITVVDAGGSKTVEFYNGCTGAAADAVRPRIERLGRTIDQQLDTTRWIGKLAAPGEIERTDR
ncbi:hypothetical protein B0E51_03885 [Rhodanobacter sp. C05]|nr:hypothetical protein B0E51_03885 [Rhodanobacter sp. C05]